MLCLPSLPGSLLRTRGVRTAVLLVIIASVVFIEPRTVSAQVQPPPGDPGAPADEEVLELSPFRVAAQEDVGYVATSSLAGTRIRTNLRDLANPITVVTEEFMRDVDAKDSVGLLVFTGSTEAGGVAGNYSGADVGSPTEHTSVTRQPQNNTRVRGLAQADLTRDYFPTTVVFDRYNTARVEINRGPNATLFGLGSPGGIINNQLIQPTLQNRHSVELNIGSFGSYRSVVDLDRVIIPEKLGLRVALLDEREEFQQNYTFDEDKRLFAALRAQPFKNATLRASYEKGSVDANRPRANSPRDTLTLWWSAPFNKITHSPATDEFNSIDRDLLRGPGEWFGQPGVVYESNTATNPARMMRAWYTLTGVPRVPGGNPNTGFQANMVSITKGDQWYPSATAAANGIQHGSFYTDEEIGDVSIFDWRNQLLDGPNKREWEDFHVFNVSYDQNWQHALGSVGFEAAYNRENMERSYFDMFAYNRGYTINIDVNTTLPWGEPNPNFGRPFVAGDANRNTNDSERETRRLTAFFELDFAKNTERLRWLGRHNFTAFYNTYELVESSLTATNRADLDWVTAARSRVNPPSARDDINSADGNVRTVVYIGPSLADLDSPQGINLQGIQTELQPATVTGWDWDPATLSFTTRNVTIANALHDDSFYSMISGGSLSRQEIDSYAFIHQAYLLPEEWLVATLGYRRDKMEDFRNNLGQDVRDQYNFIDRTNANFRVPDAPGAVFEEGIWSYGFVVHRPPFVRLSPGMDLSLHWGQSENFQPADARIDIFGRNLTPPRGTTEDRGFSVSLFNGRCSRGSTGMRRSRAA